jgi:hypothetical protein
MITVGNNKFFSVKLCGGFSVYSVLKRFIISFSFFIFSFSLASAQHDYTWQERACMGFKGKIKEMKAKVYPLDTAGFAVLTEGVNYTMDFDKAGHQLMFEQKHDEDSYSLEDYIHKNKLDSAGRLTGEETYYTGGALNEYITYTYDRKGWLIRKDYHNSDSSIYLTDKFLYNDKGQNIQRDGYKKDTILFTRSIFNYNAAGIDTQDAEYNYLELGGSMLYIENIKYDSLGRDIRKTWTYYHGGIYKDRYDYKYDDEGLKVETDRYYKSDTLYEKITYTYDAYGNATEEKSVRTDGETRDLKFTYQYDKRGNWTKMVEYYFNTPRVSVTRTFEYY